MRDHGDEVGFQPIQFLEFVVEGFEILVAFLKFFVCMSEFGGPPCYTLLQLAVELPNPRFSFFLFRELANDPMQWQQPADSSYAIAKSTSSIILCVPRCSIS